MVLFYGGSQPRTLARNLSRLRTSSRRIVTNTAASCNGFPTTLIQKKKTTATATTLLPCVANGNHSYSSTSSSQQQPNVRDRRIAGRQRFYRNVDIQRLDPDETPRPWNMLSTSNKKTSKEVASPISSGVDGTHSPTGVVPRGSNGIASQEVKAPQQQQQQQQQHHLLRHYLTPRKLNFEEPQHALDQQRQQQQQQTETEEPTAHDWYGITLDGRLLQTPMGQTLQVPSELWAAQIAQEWNAVSGLLNPTQMPAMTLSCTVLDQTAPFPTTYQEQCQRFVPTDTLCYWADPLLDADRLLHQRQEQAWRPVHDLVQTVTGHALATVFGTQEGIMLLSRRGLPHDPALLDYSRAFCQHLDAWHLTALQSLAVESKSFWWAWALLHQHLHASANGDDKVFEEVGRAVEAARVEEEHQISNWGLVEGQHDYDRLNTSINTSAALMLVDCLNVDATKKQ